MDLSFFTHLEQLELMAFFSGYPLVYAIIYVIAGKRGGRSGFKKHLVSVLPYGYALTGLLYWGLQLRNAYPEFSIDQAFGGLEYPYLKIWALTSVLFFIPMLSKKPIISLLHSLPFFYLLLKDIYLQITDSDDQNSYLRNDMKVYTTSILLILAVEIILVSLYTLLIYYRSRKSSSR